VTVALVSSRSSAQEIRDPCGRGYFLKLEPFLLRITGFILSISRVKKITNCEEVTIITRQNVGL